MNADVEMELGAALRKREYQAAPDKGGWSAYFGLMDRSVPNSNPYSNNLIRADGLAAWDGWPTSPRIEALCAAWLDAGNIDDQRRICTELQMQLWQDVPYIPMGEYWRSPPIAKIWSTYSPAASLYSTTCAELEAINGNSQVE
jgi:peptide/nickel transport system substrate-binding protein